MSSLLYNFKDEKAKRRRDQPFSKLEFYVSVSSVNAVIANLSQAVKVRTKWEATRYKSLRKDRQLLLNNNHSMLKHSRAVAVVEDKLNLKVLLELNLQILSLVSNLSQILHLRFHPQSQCLRCLCNNPLSSNRLSQSSKWLQSTNKCNNKYPRDNLVWVRCHRLHLFRCNYLKVKCLISTDSTLQTKSHPSSNMLRTELVILPSSHSTILLSNNRLLCHLKASQCSLTTILNRCLRKFLSNSKLINLNMECTQDSNNKL